MNRFLTASFGALLVFVLANPVYAISVAKFKEQIVGKTITMHHQKKNIEIVRYFDADGTVVENRENRGYRKGHWNITGKKLCVAFPGKAAKCRKFMKKSGKYGTANRKGTKMALVYEGYRNGNQIQAPDGAASPGSVDQSFREEVVTINTRGKVTQSFLLIEPTVRPKGIVLLFPGHEGVVRFNKVGNQYDVDNKGGGLPAHKKSREELSNAGYAVAILAPPSDRKRGMDTSFRFSNKHATDVKKVIEYLRNKYSQKVYVWGHCRGTFSPSSVVSKLKNKGIAGMILSSTRSTGKYGSVTDLPQGLVKVPVLLVQHVDDPCEGTPFKNLPKLKAFYESSAPGVKVVTVSGGVPRGEHLAPGCSGGYHAFKGVRKPVMKAIIKWLNKEEVPQSVRR